MIEFEDFSKLNLKIAEVVSTENKQITVNYENENISTATAIDVKKGDKITVGILDDKILIPSINNKIFLKPDQDMEPGNIVG